MSDEWLLSGDTQFENRNNDSHLILHPLSFSLLPSGSVRAGDEGLTKGARSVSLSFLTLNDKEGESNTGEVSQRI